MKRRGFIKSLGLTPLIPLAIKKKSGEEEIPEGLMPLINLGIFTEQELQEERKKLRKNRIMSVRLAKNAHNTLERLTAEALNE